MSHWGSEKGGVREVRDWGVFCVCVCACAWKECRDKRGCGCIQCAGGVSVSEATSRNHIPPPRSLSLPGPFLCYTRRRRGGDTGEGKPTALFAGSWGLGGEKLPFLRTGCSSAVVVPPTLTTTRRAVRRGAVRFWGWRYNPEQRSVGARNERAETSFASAFESGPNASLRPTRSASAAARVSRRRSLFRPGKGERRRANSREETRREGDAQVGGYNVPSKPTTGE